MKNSISPYTRYLTLGLASFLMVIAAVVPTNAGSGLTGYWSGNIAAVPAGYSKRYARKPGIMLAQGGCGSVANKVARQNGGQVANARVATKGGSKVCVVTVLIPNGSNPPRRKIVEVPIK